MSERNKGFLTSLRMELIISTVLIVVVLVGLMGFVVTTFYSNALIKSKAESVLIFLRGSGSSLVSNTNNPRDFTDIISSASNIGIESIVVVDRYGHITHKGGNKDISVFEVEETLKKVLLDLNDYIYFDSPKNFFLSSSRKFQAAIPIVSNNTVYGAIWCSADLGYLHNFENKVLSWTIGILFFSALIMAGFSGLFLSRRLVVPIRKLKKNLEDLSSGAFKLDTPKTPNLATEVNALFDAFEKSATELILKRKYLEKNVEELKKTQEQLINSERMAVIGHMSSSLAHELGNPIGALMGFVHILKREDLTFEEKEMFLNRSDQELIRMDSILKNLLHFARPDKSELGPINLNEVIDIAIALMEVQKSWGKITVKLDLAADLKPVLGEKNLILQVLINLLNNAVQSINSIGKNETGKITITTGYTFDDDTWICLSDNGGGIARDMVAHMFEPYYSSKDRSEGTGLGLPISWSIVHGLGGRLEYVPSTQGAVFMIYLLSYNPEK